MSGDPPQLYPEEIKLNPRTFWTGRGRFFADAITIRIFWAPPLPSDPARATIVRATIIAIHELTILHRRHTEEVKLTLQRALRQVMDDGLTFWLKDQVYTVPPERLRISTQLRIGLYVRPPEHFGPFRERAAQTSDGEE